MATVNPINHVNSIGRCQVCGSVVGKKFWDFTLKNIVFGPWGVISLVVTPIYLVTNTVSYVSALHKLRGAIE
jgi:hypothetical protein